MRITLFLLLLIFNLSNYGIVAAQNQGISNHWLMGYSSFGGLPFGNPRIDFYSGSPIVSFDSLEMEFNHTHSSISDTQGNLLFYTNGVYIADASHDTMMNGSGINPSTYTSYFTDGLGIPQANMILPLPDNNHLFYFLHTTANQYPGYTCSYNLYLSIVDMNLNNGLGSVITKNQIILTDSLNYGKITATKHANGRDWWILCHRLNSNKIYMFSLTPSGVSGPFSQNIGSVRLSGAGNAYFSPDGSRYAHYWSKSTGGVLEIFDFDRCNGILSNPVSVSLPYENSTQVGMAFSGNSNVLYVANVFHIYQFDLTSSNIPASLDTVATYDGYLSVYPGWPGLGTLFCLSALAPDGKIYITTGNGTLHMHTIDNPDVVGIGCNVNQHSVQLPAFYFNTLPNHPNYFLGCDTTSTCPCLITDTQELSDFISVKSYPNPTTGPVTFQFPVQKTNGELDVYDVNGRLVLRDYIAPWSQFKKLDLSHFGTGIYFCKLRWGTVEGASKVIFE